MNLSICIPTYNRADLLNGVLHHLKEFIGEDTEVIVSDNASTAETRLVALEAARSIPHLRYYRHEENIGVERNLVSALRRAKKKYCVYLADDDRLIPEGLEEILDYMDSNPDIVMTQAPWELGGTHPKDLAIEQFYQIEQIVVFEHGAEEAECFDFIIEHGIFPEIAVYRTNIMDKLSTPTQHAHFPFVWLFEALKWGDVCFHPTSFYRSIIRQDGGNAPAPRGQLGHNQVFTHLDQYRAGLEIAAFMAGEDYRCLDQINDFMRQRYRVACQISINQKDWETAKMFYIRQAMCIKENRNDEEIYEWIRRIDEWI